jgi:hypothetical protein
MSSLNDNAEREIIFFVRKRQGVLEDFDLHGLLAQQALNISNPLL